ncbi:XdhC/CoxI family protein [Alteromonas sp. D210916BOD_24]
MLFSDAGHQLGILSGGCLESDIVKKAQRVMTDGSPRTLTYDDEDEQDIAFKLGVGCGGIVHIALVPLDKRNGYLALDDVSKVLSKGNACDWTADLKGIRGHCKVVAKRKVSRKVATYYEHEGNASLSIRFFPPIHLLVVGGGYDATFMTRLANMQGWVVSIWDPRPAQARVEHFTEVNYVIDDTCADGLTLHLAEHNVLAAVLMSHHREVDAKALAILSKHQLTYIAMLGPLHRKQEILELAGLSKTDFCEFFASPAGFDIGGDLPEHIALSVISQCHAVFHGKNTKLMK